MMLHTISDAVALEKFASARGGAASVVVADHELRDEKGRAVGGRVIVRGPWTPSAGQYAGRRIFTLYVYATRNGEDYGATPTKASAVVSTLEEAATAAEKALVAQGKRYAKKYGARS